MSTCPQTKDQSVLQHGISVRNYLFELLDYLEGRELTRNWRLPEWLDEYKDEIAASIVRTTTREKLNAFAVFHDCGKPYCRTLDSSGKQHFPDHDRKSYEVWMQVFNDEEVGQLILHEMDIHTISAAELDAFIQRGNAVILLLTGLASVHANAEMFGGLDSTPFKIKLCQIDRRGKAICKKLFKK
jgi:hypothetical protein